jgi:polyhydroxyalkanoic acid synthase PhaR subunit
MSDQASTTPDPFTVWRQWLSDSERQWNSFLNEAMSTEQYSQAMARSMDMFLSFQKTMNDSMSSYFGALNIPTRTDILNLGDRLSAIEDRLVSLEGTLGRMKGQVTAANNSDAPPQSPIPAPRPPRTKRPAKA